MLSVSECGINTLEANHVINVKFESKNLTLSKDKCKQLHIGKKKRNKEECKVSNKLLVHEDKMKVDDKIKYFGEVITSSGLLDDNIEDRTNRAIGIRSKIKSLIDGISLGSCHFEICMIMREAVYLNSILVNAETWYSLTSKQISLLESADISYLQICFNSNAKTIRDSYYLETGIIKIRHILAKRRIMFLQNILKRNPQLLLRKVYEVKKFDSNSLDWCDTVKNYLHY